MRKEITVSAEPRESRGKNEARRLRVKGLAPAVLYGSDRAAVAVSVNPKDVNKILHSNTGHNTIFNLSVQGGEDTPVMIVDWQSDPVKENLLHVDLKRIDLAKRNACLLYTSRFRSMCSKFSFTGSLCQSTIMTGVSSPPCTDKLKIVLWPVLLCRILLTSLGFTRCV